jgi:Effector protein
VTYPYSSAIVIEPVQGKTFDVATALDPRNGARFENFIKAALKILAKSQPGAMLINEINSSGHTCTIFAGGQYDDNCAKAYPCNVASGLARMVLNFRPLQKNMPQSIKANKNPLRPGGQEKLPDEEARPIIQAYRDYKADLKSLGDQYALPTDRNTAGLVFAQIMNKARAAMDVRKWRNKLYACGSSEAEVTDIIMGERKIDDAKYYRFCLEFYDYLIPGKGCDTQVRIQPPAVFQEKNADLIAEAGTRKSDKIVAALLGHELIHAWRMMVGRRVVDDGWDEEMMTVGLGRCSGWPMTENRLRAGMGLPLRKSYQPLSRYFSPDMSELMKKDDQFDAVLF